MSEAEDYSDNVEDETTLDQDDDRFEGEEFSEYQEGDPMTDEERDEKEFEELIKQCPDYLTGQAFGDTFWCHGFTKTQRELAKFFFDGSRRTLREQIKADPSICKLEIEEWPESPDY